LTRVVCVHLPRRALSNTWWPLSVAGRTADERRESEQTLALWLNSTLGLIMLMAVRVDSEGPWIKMKKPIVNNLPVLDPTRLTPPQRARIAQLYDQVKNADLGRVPEIAGDATRAQIDAGLMEVLGFDANLMVLRELVAHEPLLRPASAAPTAEPAAATAPGEPRQLPLVPVTAGRRPLALAASQQALARPRGARGRAS
jgi:hypothetical protein